MIKLQYGSEQLPVMVEDDEWYVTLKSDGKDKLTFVINSKDQIYNKINEESIVYANNNKYLVKNIDEHDTVVTIDCVIDLDDWKVSYFAKYMSYGNYIDDYMTLLMPGGWTYTTVGDFSEKKPIGVDKYNKATYIKSKSGLELLALVCDLWGAVPRFDALNKRVKIIQTDAVGFSGEFYSDEVNLKSLGFVGNSTDIATRVYWYGKEQSDGNYLTMSEVNDGREYVENTMYVQKNITYGYVDTGVDNPYDLYNKAMDYLLKHCKPTRSYQLQVKEVDNDLQMFSTVLIIDSVNRTRDYHQVVEMKIYPECHSMDSVTLDSLTPDNSRYYQNGIYIPESDLDTKSQIDSLDNRVSKLESNPGGGGSGGGTEPTTFDGNIGGQGNKYGKLTQFGRDDVAKFVLDNDGFKGQVAVMPATDISTDTDIDLFKVSKTNGLFGSGTTDSELVKATYKKGTTTANDERKVSILGDMFSVSDTVKDGKVTNVGKFANLVNIDGTVLVGDINDSNLTDYDRNASEVGRQVIVTAPVDLRTVVSINNSNIGYLKEGPTIYEYVHNEVSGELQVGKSGKLYIDNDGFLRVEKNWIDSPNETDE